MDPATRDARGSGRRRVSRQATVGGWRRWPRGDRTGGGRRRVWARALAELQARKPLQAGFAGQGIFLDQRGSEMVIGFAPTSQMAKDSLNRPAAKAAVEEILSALTGEPLTLKLETRSDLSPPPPPPKPELPPRPAPAAEAGGDRRTRGQAVEATAPPAEPPPADRRTGPACCGG